MAELPRDELKQIISGMKMSSGNLLLKTEFLLTNLNMVLEKM